MSAMVSPARVWLTGGASALLAAALAAYAVLVGTPPTDPIHAQEQRASLPYVIGFALVFAVIIFGFLVPWALRSRPAPRPLRVGLICSLLGLLIVPPAFWSGLPVILGVAGATLGQVGRARAQTARQRVLALAAIGVGSVAAVCCIAITILEKLAV